MTTLIKKIFLPKNKVQLLNTIEQNTDKIDFCFRRAGRFGICDMTLSTPTVFLTATHEIDRSTQSQYSRYSFEQFTPNGRILSVNTENKTVFADKVFDEMLNAYISRSHSKQKVK